MNNSLVIITRALLHGWSFDQNPRRIQFRRGGLTLWAPLGVDGADLTGLFR